MTNQVPVLMYHALTDTVSPPAGSLHISRQLFAEQLQWLAKNKYQSISIDEMTNAFAGKKDLSKSCVLSFDDGYHSLYRYAMPLLKKYHFTATLFLTTGITGNNDFDKAPGIGLATIPEGDRPLNWAEILTMRDNGWSVQSHSVTHADNSKITPGELMVELTESKKIIEAKLQQEVHHYAFPFGKYNAPSLQLVKQVGYRSAFTVHAGLCSAKSAIYRLPRLEIKSDDDTATFSKKMTTGSGSLKEKIKSVARDILFSDPRVKDMAKKIGGKNIN